MTKRVWILPGLALGFIAGLYTSIPLSWTLKATGHSQDIAAYKDFVGADSFNRMTIHTLGHYLLANYNDDLIVVHGQPPKLMWMSLLNQGVSNYVGMLDIKSRTLVSFTDRNKDGTFDMLDLENRSAFFIDTNFDGYWDIIHTNRTDWNR